MFWLCLGKKIELIILEKRSINTN